jgi:1-deoxy-D-xylulose-5-phosphate reductoisomerase
MKTVTVLGSTGSIGKSTVDLLAANPSAYRVLALVANRNAEALAAQARLLHAELAVCSDPAMARPLQAALAGTGIRVACGEDAVLAAARMGADWTMAAITGVAGLAPTLAAAERGGSIALANKEAIVSAGDVMLRAVRDAGATLLPVDSEHNAIFQALAGSDRGARSARPAWRKWPAPRRRRRCGTPFGRWAPRSASIPPRCSTRGWR